MYCLIMAYKKENSYDLEIITRNTDGSFYFEYYLPVNDDNISICPDIHDITYPLQKGKKDSISIRNDER